MSGDSGPPPRNHGFMVAGTICLLLALVAWSLAIPYLPGFLALAGFACLAAWVTRS